MEIRCLLDLLENSSDNQTHINHRVSQAKSSLWEIVKGFYRYRRTPLSHILVIMISTETRTKKPYALPIQCIPYRSITDSEVQEVLNNVIREMSLLGMEVAGMNEHILLAPYIIT